MIDAGKLDKLVTLQRPTFTRTTEGESLPTFATYAQPWANIKPISATEQIKQQNVVEHATTHIITLRYIAALTAKDQIVHGGRTFQISSAIDVDDAHDEWRLLCHEVS